MAITATPSLIPRIMGREPSALEVALFGETVRLMPSSMGNLPQDRFQKAGLFASMAEFSIERALIETAMDCLDRARSVLPQKLARRDELLLEWKQKHTQWKRWSERLDEGVQLYSKNSFFDAATILAEVARATYQDKLPCLAHQIMHNYHLDAALLAGGRSTRPLREEMKPLHRAAHEEMFWSPVTYNPDPKMIIPESAWIREALMIMKKVFQFNWGHDDDTQVMTHMESAPESDRLAIAKISTQITQCLNCINEDPATLIQSRAYYATAQGLMQKHFKGTPPDYLVLLLRTVGEYLERFPFPYP